MEQRPAAVLALDRAQVRGDARLERRIDLVEIVLQQHIFGRNGGVGLELEHPVAIGALQAEQRPRAAIDHLIEPAQEPFGVDQRLARPRSHRDCHVLVTANTCGSRVLMVQTCHDLKGNP